MTREEAIAVLNMVEAHGSLVVEAKDMAIKALEQQPSEDCVSRQAVLEIVNDWWGITSTSGEPTLCDCIRDLPPVTPTRKKGKWILNEIGVPYCSECKNLQYGGHYCANCGAEMESEE